MDSLPQPTEVRALRFETLEIKMAGSGSSYDGPGDTRETLLLLAFLVFVVASFVGLAFLAAWIFG